MNSEKKKSNFWWPDVSTLEGARNAARGGAVVACIIVAITSVFALYATFKASVLNVTAWSFLDAFFFALIAVGIWRLSRAAAVAGLTLYLVEQGFQWATIGPKSPVVAVLFILYFVNSVRGTFSYHRLTKDAASRATSEA